MNKARQLVSAGKYQAAEAILRSYIADDSRFAPAHYLLGYVLFRENKPESSLGEYTIAAGLQQPSAEDLKNVALDYVLLKDLVSARKWLKISIAADSKDADAWYSLGRVQYEQGEFQNAIDCFRQALSLIPKSIKAENNLGLAYEGLNRTEDALAAYRTAILWQLGSSHPSEQPLLNLATMLMHNGDFSGALSLLTQAVAIAPKDPKIHERLGQIYLRQSQLDKAQSELEQSVALSPEDAPGHFLLGQVYHRQGLDEKAKAEFARSATLSGTRSTPDR